MLATVYSVADGITNGMNRRSTASTLGTPFSPIRQFMNIYLKLDGSRYTDDPSYLTDEFMTEFEGRDKRIAQTIRVPGTIRSNGPAYPEQETYKYMFFHRNAKLFEGADDIALTTGSQNIDSDYYKWRIGGGFFRANYDSAGVAYRIRSLLAGVDSQGFNVGS